MRATRTRARAFGPLGLAWLLVAAAGAPAAAQGLPPLDAAPDARALRTARMPAPIFSASLELSEPETRVRHRPPTPGQAFRAELRDQAIEYRFTNRWAFADENLQGDRPVRRGRARAAERILGDAATAYVEQLFRGRWTRFEPGAREGSASHEARHRLRVDSSPSWRIEGRTRGTRLRLDVPLSAHEDLALRCTRSVSSDRCEREFGASVRLNPWDESIRFGFELEF